MATGRPLKLNEPYDVIDPRDGTILRTITRGERALEHMRLGSHFDHACTAAGMTKETGYEYKRRAAQARIRATGRNLDEVALTQNERDMIAFSDAVDAAEGEYAVNVGLQRQRLMMGGIRDVKTTTRTKFETVMVPNPNNRAELIAQRREVEREVTTVESTTLPDGPMIRWYLERRFPAIYGRTLELVDPSRQLTDEERAEPLVEALREFAASEQGKQLAAEFDAQDAEDENVERAKGNGRANGSNGKRRTKRIRDERGRIVREVELDDGGEDDTGS